MIRLDALSFRYPTGAWIFSEFGWQVARGEAWAVVGASGCGKSTLLYLLAGLQIPTSGEIRIDGKRLERPRPHTGLILQEYGLLPWATLRQNARLGIQIRRLYGPDGRHAPKESLPPDWADQVDNWLERLGIAAVAEQFPAQVSGGQRQRAAIARTLALDPDLLLMDEPFASLDVPTRESLQKLVRQLGRESRLTSVLVTHSIEEALYLGDRLLILRQGVNQHAQILENPFAGQSGTADSSEYQALAGTVRAALEGQAQ